jgi:hypothetical protein
VPSILYRLCEALLPVFEVEREMATGGMGSVFIAREVALERLVAIKIIRPELATAHATERFLREARTLAKLQHPNIVPIHRVGEAGGFSFYVMDLVEGQTLGERLQRGPLAASEVVKLGRDLLDALEAIHGLDIVHRDIKPNNIFLRGNRALLGDFGIAMASGPQTAARHGELGATGTPGYMPPEQAFGENVGAHTDLYAVGMVLYEALTGRRWEVLPPDMPEDWSGVPRPLASVLRRALAWEIADRWPNAAEFRHALWRTRAAKYRRRAVMWAVGVGLAALLGATFLIPRGGTARADIAIPAFEVRGTADPSLGAQLASLTLANLTANPGIIDVAPRTTPHVILAGDAAVAFDELNAESFTEGTIETFGDSLVATVQVISRRGEVFRAAPVPGRIANLQGVACRLGLEILRALKPAALDYECIPLPEGTPAGAVRLFLAGEDAFRRQGWERAESLYAAALAIDSSFAWARWRWINARRWLRYPTDPDLARLAQEQGDALPEIDRMLLEAWLTPLGPERLRVYRDIVRRYPRDPYTWLVYGDDLFMRGSLAGIGLDSARHVLAQGVARDSAMGPSLLALTWIAIRLGERDVAERWLQRLLQNTEREAFIPTKYFDLAFAERFFSGPQLAAARAQVFAEMEQDSAAVDYFVNYGLRWALAFDVAEGQTAIAEWLLAQRNLPRGARLDVLRAKGLGLVALGRMEEANATFDSVAALDDSIESVLQAAQWRVMPQALGIVAMPQAMVEAGRDALDQLAKHAMVGPRAAWTLAVDAYATGDATTGQRWLRTIRESDAPESHMLARHIDGLQRAALGDLPGALRLTDTLVPLVAAQVPDAFARTAIYLTRGRWRRALDPPATGGDWLWYQNADLVVWPIGIPVAAEIDWALGTAARFLRWRDAIPRRDRREACRDLTRVVEVWRDAERAFHALREAAEGIVERNCGRAGG